MSTGLAAFKAAGVPITTSALQQALTNVSTGEPAGGSFDGRELLKMIDGEWMYGQEQVEISPSELVAVNPGSFQHGWICWVDSEVMGEVMVPVSQPLPDVSRLETFMVPADPKKGVPEHPAKWDSQLRFDAQMDDGTQLLYKISSLGGKEAVKKLAQSIGSQLSVDAQKPVALVSLTSTSYEHKKYNTVYKPVFTITGWTGMDGVAPPPEEEEDEPADTMPALPTQAELQAKSVDDVEDAEVIEDEPPAEEAPPARTASRRRRRSSAAE